MQSLPNVCVARGSALRPPASAQGVHERGRQLGITITSHLRELFYDRNPGDARVKVGSERESASRRRRPNRGVGEIGDSLSLSFSRDPSKIGPVIGEFTPKKIHIGRWDSALK